jgi:hypothetical protein
MGKHAEGSIMLIVLGGFWLMSIIAAVAYTIVAQVASIAQLREIQARYQYALEGGMMTALAHLNDQPAAYAASGFQPLYEGAWPLDERHPTLGIKLDLTADPKEGGNQHYRLSGQLFEDAQRRIAVVWHLFYEEESAQWRYLWGEQILS